jgi:hypothetical protein
MIQPGRSTRNSQRSTLAENFTTSAMPPASRLSVSPTPSTRPAPDPIPPIPEVQENDEPEDNADTPMVPKSDLLPDSDRDPDPDQSEPNLARSLELLARKIGSISGAPKAQTAIKPRTPDVFDGTDPSKIDTFVFQCSMYMATCLQAFTNKWSKVLYTISYLKGNLLNWFQTELSDCIEDEADLPHGSSCILSS